MPTPIPVRLTPAERRGLQRLQVTAQSRRAWTRATALLMLAAGQPCRQVAEALSVCLNTVTNWKRRWWEGRYGRLPDAAYPGRPPKASPKYQKLLEEAVERGPQAYGYIFTVWSAAHLASHLKQQTGIRLCPKQVRRWLQKLDFVYRRPKHTLRARQNCHEVCTATKRLHTLKKGL